MFLKYSRIALRKRSKRGRGMERTQPMIYRPLLLEGIWQELLLLSSM